MEYINSIEKISIREPSVITLGKFDGLHRGHRLLIEEMKKGAGEGLRSVAFTFDMPPIAAECGRYELLSAGDEKIHIFEETGVDCLIECPFAEEIKRMSPREFLYFLAERIAVRRIVAGSDFRFGCNRAGGAAELRAMAGELGFDAVIVRKMCWHGAEISSSLIRAMIRDGKLETANELLGYPYFLSGIVRHGMALGRSIGVPTANLAVGEHKLLPPQGVYDVRIEHRGRSFRGICNVGSKPTVAGGDERGVEAYLFDYDGDLYGETIRILFMHFLRGEIKFDSVFALKAQIEEDIARLNG